MPPICSMMCRVYATKISASYGVSPAESSTAAALATAVSNRDASTCMPYRAQKDWYPSARNIGPGSISVKSTSNRTRES